jgi:ADP-ribosylglycohydrolase
MNDKLKSAIFGAVVGDALGVPVEFKTRYELKENLVTNMREYGSHDQPKGSWSDDRSMTFCLMDNIIKHEN